MKYETMKIIVNLLTRRVNNEYFSVKKSKEDFLDYLERHSFIPQLYPDQERGVKFKQHLTDKWDVWKDVDKMEIKEGMHFDIFITKRKD